MLTQSAIAELYEMPRFDREKAAAAINKKLGKSIIQSGQRTIKLKYLVRYAAVLAFLVVSGAFYYYFMDVVTISNDNQNAYAYVLADGSEVVLGPQSKLFFHRNYGWGKRELSLDGNVHFNVVSNPVKPFRVVLDERMIEVLGTRFVVDQTGEKKYSIRLLEGKIRLVDGLGREWDIAAGQAVNSTPKTTVFDTESPDEYTRWMPDSIRFEDVSLVKAIYEINQYYGKELIRFDDKSDAASCMIHSTFIPGRLDDFLEEIQLLFKIKLRSYNGSFAIEEINCNS